MRTRLLLPLLAGALLAAGSAAAQTPATRQVELDTLRAQQQALARQAIAQQNDATATEARRRADQAILDLENQKVLPALPALPYAAPAGDAAMPSGGAAAALVYPSTPDSILADSNRRVQAAAKNRH